MNIQSFYIYSWFANLAYVDWRPSSFGSSPNIDDAILDASAPGTERVPGNTIDPLINTLGEKIFKSVEDGGEGWRVADFSPNDPNTGFSASLFVNDSTGEKVLGIRGTEGGGPLEQLYQDLLKADLLEIGFLGGDYGPGVD